MNLQTIQQASINIGVHTDSIRKMIRDKKIHEYKQDGFNRTLIDLDELYSTFKPTNHIKHDFNLDRFHV